MKNASIVFLLVLMVSIQTPAGQLFKLPLLIEHFFMHQDQNGDTLYGFLKDHYATDHQDADFPEDEQLPFKNITYYTIGFAIVPEVMKAGAMVPFSAEKLAVTSGVFVMQQHFISIFRPPRA